MDARIRIEHNSKGWIEIFKSAEMQTLVNETGERIAGEAGEDFQYEPATNSNFTAGGFVVPANYMGSIEEAVDKTLTKAVHA